GVPKALKENFPGARVTFVASTAGVELLKENPFVDELIAYDAPWFARGRRASRLGFGGLVSELSRRGFDLGFSLRGDLRENFLLWFAGVKERVGYGVTGGGFFLTREVRYRTDVHERRRTPDLLDAAGVRAGSAAEPRLYFSDRETAEFDAKLPALGIEPGRRYAGFQPFSGTRAKDWPQEHAAEFVRGFRKRFPAVRLVLVGSGESRLEGADAIDLTGRTSVRELCLLLKKFELFVGPDSGPAHLAAALGVSTVFLYSGTNELKEWGPAAESARVLRQPVDCSPCGLTECAVAGHPCMARITPAQVLDAAAGRLGNG
ncbi:MAG TPA: glycosyltransferase family 9 protein, partial [Candidatus Eisenbacteria bacterium]|nr:glycosyltransferase family 9 protein [Candidatus Eisenbacteria bacterium]